MKRLVFVAILAGCGGQPVVEETSVTSRSLVAECDSAVANFDASIAEVEASATSASFVPAFSKLQELREGLQVESHPCLAEGEQVVLRQQHADRMRSAGLEATERVTIKALESTSDPLATEAILKARFATGDSVSDAIERKAIEFSQAKNRALWEEFQKTKKYSEKEDKQTTCIFARQEFDPQNMEYLFASVFDGAGDVHALCRVPLPASRFAGDPAGTIELVLDDDSDLNNGTVAIVKLGTVEAFKETQYFRGRFNLPHAALRTANKKSSNYTLSVRFARPSMGDEVPVSASFFWME